MLKLVNDIRSWEARKRNNSQTHRLRAAKLRKTNMPIFNLIDLTLKHPRSDLCFLSFSHVQQAAGLDDVHGAREAALLQDLLRTTLRAKGCRLRSGRWSPVHGYRRAVRQHRPPIVSLNLKK